MYMTKAMEKWLVDRFGDDGKEVYDGIIFPSIKNEYYTGATKTKKYSDIIRVEYNLITCGRTRKEEMEWLRKYKNILDSFTVYAINKVRRKYFINTNLLKLTNLVYTRDSRLVYTFEYKIPRIEETQ